MIEPPRIMLGHDTKKIADPRSVESLVDYSQSNISWLQKVGDDGTNDTRRLQRRMQAAAQAKAQKPELGDHYVEDVNMTGQGDDEVDANLVRLAQREGIPIDPALGTEVGERVIEGESQDGDECYNENPEEAGLSDICESYHQGPPQPQHVIPAGGIIRDVEHAYDSTEAITFDYPDPEIEVQAPQSIEQAPARAQAPPGYEPAVSPEKSPDIEMVRRKRKRSGVAAGEEPAQSHQRAKDNGAKNKKKQRKSLVVKLNVGKSGLTELNKMAIIAQRALRGVEEDDTPVIGSDLRALNVKSGAVNDQQLAKKVRLEREDEDDDFAGPRVRKDRPKSIPERHTVPMRRTRTQNMAYDVPSDDEEFEEVLGDHIGRDPQRRTRPAQSSYRRPIPGNSSNNTDSSGSGASSTIDIDAEPPLEHQAIATDHPHATTGATQGTSTGADRIKSGTFLSDENTSAPESVRLRPTNASTITPLSQARCNVQMIDTDHTKSAPGRSTSGVVPTPPVKAKQKNRTQSRVSEMSEAEKNRKAKLAAMHWAEGESVDFEAEMISTSEEEGLLVPEARGVRVEEGY